MECVMFHSKNLLDCREQNDCVILLFIFLKRMSPGQLVRTSIILTSHQHRYEVTLSTEPRQMGRSHLTFLFCAGFEHWSPRLSPTSLTVKPLPWVQDHVTLFRPYNLPMINHCAFWCPNEALKSSPRDLNLPQPRVILQQSNSLPGIWLLLFQSFFPNLCA